MKAMLAESADVNHLDTYLAAPEWVAQQKLDGDRVLVQVRDGKVTALNRQGDLYRNPFPRRVLREFETLSGNWTFDGELLDEYWLFDLPEANVHVSPARDYGFRSTVLDRFFAGWSPAGCVRLLPLARTTTAKVSLVEQLVAAGGEGVMFKRLDAPYRPGKRTFGMMKAKFTDTLDAVVTAVSPDGRANCHYAVFEDGRLVEIGSAKTEGKGRIEVGDVIEVRYLYAGSDRRLVQPRIVRRRHDKAPDECRMDQLKFTNRNLIVVPDDRPVHRTSAQFVSKVLRDAGLPRASAYRVTGRDREGYQVMAPRDGEITVHATAPYEEGRKLLERVRAVLVERGVVVADLPSPGVGGVYGLEVRGRHR